MRNTVGKPLYSGGIAGEVSLTDNVVSNNNDPVKDCDKAVTKHELSPPQQHGGTTKGKGRVDLTAIWKKRSDKLEFRPFTKTTRGGVLRADPNKGFRSVNKVTNKVTLKNEG
ncbi:hypothetical protein M422DRAFT_258437 [Sphaerobolus stellatus SS14]|uniref:Unplaced genomic scaffold SPHSTscaffold_82, whole genome shotgun sequence n=1 Tax=Sphaerobolus stellatus (strain SS14) TaxID=990650 RepID=A0A0C9U733_SPHS4|nr:hypothetical protein M422DRAFT_258437 [Sphaerobolus stellatus SS14]